MTPNEMTVHIANVIEAHARYARVPSKSFRRFDGKTPFSVHPIWCAMTIATESTLSEEVRDLVFLALLYHDVPEDTTMVLPADLSAPVCAAVRAMTFANTADEMERVWDQSPLIRLLKLYDKTNNMLNLGGWEVKNILAYRDYADDLSNDVLHHYGFLNIHAIFRGVDNELLHQVSVLEKGGDHVAVSREENRRCRIRQHGDEWPDGGMWD